jgi:hypothetical protein
VAFNFDPNQNTSVERNEDHRAVRSPPRLARRAQASASDAYEYGVFSLA